MESLRQRLFPNNSEHQLADKTSSFEERHSSLSSGPHLVLSSVPQTGELGASLPDVASVKSQKVWNQGIAQT